MSRGGARPGAGRPPADPTVKKSTRNFWVSEEEYVYLHEELDKFREKRRAAAKTKSCKASV